MSNLPSTDVHNLREPRFLANYSLGPREAVRAAYAQFEKKDYNTWGYAKYDHLIVEGKYTVSCGDYTALWEFVGQNTDQKDGALVPQ